MKKMVKDMRNYVGAGVGIGVGSMILGAANAPAGVMSGMSTMGGMMGVVGTATMGKHALRLTNKAFKKHKKYKY